MWKDTILQLLVALLPVFAFQIWYDRPGRQRGISVFLGLLSGISLLLCLYFSTNGGLSLDIAFRLVPLIVGCLYGGYIIAFVLAVSYIIVRVYMLDALWESVMFSLFILIFLPVLFLSISSFQRAARRARQRIAATLGGGVSLFIVGTHITFILIKNPAFLAGAELYLYCFTNTLLIGLEVWASIFFIESVIEKELLYQQLQRMSLKYRNEVHKLQQFIDVAPLAVIVTDREGMITHINDNAVRSISDDFESVNQIIGQSITATYPNIADSVNGQMLQCALKGAETCSEIEQDQQKTYIKTSFSVRDLENNDIIGAALIAHDITELTRLKDEIGRMDRLSLVGQMAASITHEIRNPMAVIRGFVQLMRERSPDHQQEYFRIIMEELDRANNIINDFLSLAQNRVIEKEICSLHDILSDLEPLLWADANLRGQSIQLDYCEGMPLLELNRKEIKQLILNLTRNGMEAMSEKGLLKISTRCLESMIELRVTDSGSGIPKDELERLFEPFYTTKTRGTGLGLPLCLSIAERHKGIIEVDSKEGEGTTFIVTFARSEIREETDNRPSSGAS